MIKGILAMNANRVIGDNNKLIWNEPEDLARFKALTLNQTVVMGRNTWEGLPVRPLPNRLNIVVASQFETVNGWGTAESLVTMASGASQAVGIAKAVRPNKDIWFIGGAQLFSTALPLIQELYVTILHNNHLDGDTTMPWFEDQFVVKHSWVLNSDRNVVQYLYVPKSKAGS